MTSQSPTAPSLASLASALQGRLINPDDHDYDAQRQVFLGDVDKRPAAIARVANANDGARVIGFARDNGVDLAVRCGGHSSACSTDGGLVLDVRDLTTIDIDPAARTVWAGAGLSAAELTNATGEHGLAVGFGDTGSVGISGITLGGGIRLHGAQARVDDRLAAGCRGRHR